VERRKDRSSGGVFLFQKRTRWKIDSDFNRRSATKMPAKIQTVGSIPRLPSFIAPRCCVAFIQPFYGVRAGGCDCVFKFFFPRFVIVTRGLAAAWSRGVHLQYGFVDLAYVRCRGS